MYSHSMTSCWTSGYCLIGNEFISYFTYLQIRKRDVDMFGSDDLPIPLSCPVTVWAKEAPDTVEHLSYSVPLIGVDCDGQKIYIDRFLEKGTTGI